MDGAQSPTASVTPPAPLRHACPSRLVEHIQKHLAAPGLLALMRWAFPGALSDPVWANDRTLIAALRRSTDHEEFRAVEQGYYAIVDRVVEHASVMGWCAFSRRRATVGMSPSGLMVVHSGGILRTMYLPGIRGDLPHDVLMAVGRIDSSLDALKAVGSPRRRRRSSDDARAVRRGEGRGQARRAGMHPLDRDQAYFERVFRPAKVAIMRAPTVPMPGRWTETGELSRIVSLARCRSIEAWQAACHLCGWCLAAA
ncbi:MAG: hypothetical protein RJA05_1982 [Planctomycetota bacterium]